LCTLGEQSVGERPVDIMPDAPLSVAIDTMEKSMSTNTILLVARVLLSFMFILSGVMKFGSIGGTAGYIASVGLPAATALAWLAAIFETFAGLAILVGYQTRIAAYLLAAFCVFAGYVFHFNPADQMQFISFMKNLTIAGGFLALSESGAGAWSVDARMPRGRLAAA
jgi:putative oxidoreductase